MTPAMAAALAEGLRIALPVLLDQLARIGCIVCEETLEPADAPDLLSEGLANRLALARRATGTDRASVDAALRSDADELDRASER